MNKIQKYKLLEVIEYTPYFYIATIFFLLAMVFGSLSLYEMEKTRHITTDYAIITGVTSNNMAVQGSYYFIVALCSVACGLFMRVYNFYWTTNYNRILRDNKIDIIN